MHKNIYVRQVFAIECDFETYGELSFATKVSKIKQMAEDYKSGRFNAESVENVCDLTLYKIYDAYDKSSSLDVIYYFYFYNNPNFFPIFFFTYIVISQYISLKISTVVRFCRN